MKELALFFNNSPKRQMALEECFRKALSAKLIDLCRTGWAEGIDSLEVLFELLEAVVKALETIRSNDGGSWNMESMAQACKRFP